MRHKKNITLNLQSITSHFTGKRKIIILSLLILMLSLINITLGSSNNSNSVLSLFGLSTNSVSALSYESEVGIGFTFNPTLSISFSSSDLVISNLTPGTTSDSNNIVVSVSTNASHGYTLAVNTNSDNLVHSNNTNVFNSIATDASIESLTSDNTWGYSYKLSNNTVWSNYSGLSSSTTKTLVNTDNQSSKPIDFKIGAKASATQASGEYTNIINFIAVTKPIPKTIEDIAYMQTFSELVPTDLQSVKNSMVLNQDYILKDSRDEKEYYVTRLGDGNVWMTQNLSLDLSIERPLNSLDTDLNNFAGSAYQDDYVLKDDIIYWTPERNTIASNELSANTWSNDYYNPYSYNRTSNIIADHNSYGNYYNWTAAIASSNSSSFTAGDAANSVCPKGWKLPSNKTYDFSKLLFKYGITKDAENTPGYADGANMDKIIALPLGFVRAGDIYNGSFINWSAGIYWTSTALSGAAVNILYFTSQDVRPSGTENLYGQRMHGAPIRCLAR